MTAHANAERGLSIRAYAAHRRAKQLRGGSRAAVEKALQAGRIHKNASGKIDPEQADAEWEQSTGPVPEPDERPPEPVTSPRTPKPTPPEAPAAGGPSYGQSRAVREAYQARLTRLDYEERTGALVKTDTVSSFALK